MLKKLIFLLFFFSSLAQSSDFSPSNLIKLDPSIEHHVLIAEKATHLLHLYEVSNQKIRKLRSFEMASGKKRGDKMSQGDHKTPEGVYSFVDFLTHADLVKRHGKEGEIYGVGAFVMNFPNPIDKIEGKTGGGIWLHSTNDETRIDKGLDSRGCLVIANKDLIELAEYLELHRNHIVVVERLSYLDKSGREAIRREIESFVMSWKEAWEKEDSNNYLSHYDKTHFKDPVRGNFKNFSSYKRAIFKRKNGPTVNIEKLNIFGFKDSAVVRFVQDYTSKSINDKGMKTLYLKRDSNYNWKIISELWTKKGVPEKDQIAFTPSQRFFEKTMPEEILEIRFRDEKEGRQ